MAEEQQFHAEGHRLCANNCGFFGSPATMNLCSKCYIDLHHKEEHHALAKAAFDHAPGPSSCPSWKRPEISGPGETVQAVTIEPIVARPEHFSPAQRPNRCLTCRKRVGLTGFRCRCGSMYCGAHRYPEQHGCTYDYKKVGKEAIAKSNPVVKAKKLDKI